MGGGRSDKRRPNTNNNNNNNNNDNNNNRGKSRNNNNNNRGKSRNNNNNKGRSKSFFGRNSLFVVGGVLSDFSPTSLSPSSSSFAGRNSAGGSSKLGGFTNNQEKTATSSKRRSDKSSGNAFGYTYPSVELQEGLQSILSVDGNDRENDIGASHPIVLVDSKETQIVAYIDEAPSAIPVNSGCFYNYTSEFRLENVTHRGLGFADESEATPRVIGLCMKEIEDAGKEQEGFLNSLSAEEGMDAGKTENGEVDGEVSEAMQTEPSSPRKNIGFVSIGGLKLFTHDISDGESNGEDDEELLDDESSESSEQTPDVSESGVSEDTFDSDLDVDDEVAEDYLEGIGGSDNILDAKWLVGNDLDDSDEDDSSNDSFDNTVQKLDGIALQEAFSQYGMQRRAVIKKQHETATEVWSSAMDDLMLVKDPRTVYAKKKHVARLPQSWPVEAQESKRARNFPGMKKKHRKEMIAVKRRERMLNRGVDIEKINTKLEQIVLNQVDMFSFPPMHSRDCSQVQKLAAIYRLRSASQGSGKKRFVTVTRTQHTCMPSPNDRIRLERFIGAGNEHTDFTVNDSVKLDDGSMIRSRTSKMSKGRSLSNRQSSSASKRNCKKSYANQPMSFVSSGVMQSDVVETRTGNEMDETCKDKTVASTTKVGTFELHTKGFGSKMLAKMGYIEGGGLGKDGRGMAEPIQVIQRPKSLGLGANFPSTSVERDKTPHSVGTSQRHGKVHNFAAFEKHTKGFGSKLMARMGFIEGKGLGKDCQGIATPLVAVRLPKSRGLGAKS